MSTPPPDPVLSSCLPFLPLSFASFSLYLPSLSTTFHHPNSSLSALLTPEGLLAGTGNLHAVDASGLGECEEPLAGVLGERRREMAEEHGC